MQRRELLMAAAILIAGTGALSPSLAAAAAVPNAVHPSLERLQLVETVTCYGFGWRGWGIYPGWYPACNRAVQVYAAPGHVTVPAVPAPGRCGVATSPDRRSGYWQAC